MGYYLARYGLPGVCLPKSSGNGFFTQLLSNGEYKPLRFPIWDMVAFYGTREHILLHKHALLDAVEPLAVTAVTTTATAPSPASENYLNVNYAPSLTLPQLAEAKDLIKSFSDVFDDTYLAGRVVGVECDIDTQPFQVSPAKRAKIDAKID